MRKAGGTTPSKRTTRFFVKIGLTQQNTTEAGAFCRTIVITPKYKILLLDAALFRFRRPANTPQGNTNLPLQQHSVSLFKRCCSRLPIYKYPAVPKTPSRRSSLICLLELRFINQNLLYAPELRFIVQTPSAACELRCIA